MTPEEAAASAATWVEAGALDYYYKIYRNEVFKRIEDMDPMDPEVQILLTRIRAFRHALAHFKNLASQGKMQQLNAERQPYVD